MILYAIIMFAVAILFLVMSVLIYRGKTNLIHDYHQTKVTDHSAYGKAFGKALSIFGIAMLASGVVSLISDSMLAIWLLAIGLVLGIAAIVAVQKKYNNGIF